MNKNVILGSSYYNSTGYPGDYKCLHSHHYDEISLIAQGDIKYISDNIIDRVEGKSIIFSKAYQLHNPYVEQEKKYERYQIAFMHSSISNEIIKEYDCDSFILPINDETFEEILGYMKTINREIQAKADDELTLTKHKLLLNVIYAKIMSIYKNNKHIPKKITKSYINNVMEYIEHNCRNKLKIENIASEFYVSRTKLIKDFSSHTGVTVAQFVTLSRIKLAKEYLKKGYSVTDTAELCGFSNSGHFISVFAEMNGITPLKYRQNQ